MNVPSGARASAPAFCALALTVAVPVVQADHTAAHQLDTVTVTAVNPSTQNSAADARAEVARTAGGATVVDAADLRDQRAGTLSDALAQAAGVFAQSRFGAQEMRLSIRGSGLQRTFHTRGITVLQDGVPLNLADGSGDFQSIDPLAASHIEIFRGANALQYGSGTLGGSVNFVTDTGYTAGRELRLEGGSFGYQRAYASSGLVRGALDGFASVGYSRQDGFRDHAQQEELRFTGNLGARLEGGIENRTFLTLTTSESELPGSLTRAQLDADPRQSNTANRPNALDQRRDTRVLRLANKSVAKTGEHTQTEFALYLSRKELDHPIFQVILQDNFDYGVSLRTIHTAPLFGHANRLVVGLNPQFGLTKGSSFVNTPGTGAFGARADASRQAAGNFIAYGENQWAATKQLTLVGGAQAIVAERNQQDRFVPAGQADSSYERRYTGFSPKIGAIYALDRSVQLFGNFASSFEPPSFGEGPQAIAGGPLKPQRAATVEIGTRGRVAGFDWDLGVYRARIRDELLSLQTPVGGSLTSGVTVNADKTVHRGVEASVTARPLPWASIRLNGLYNDFRLNGDKTFGDRQLPGIPPWLLRSEWRGDFRIGGLEQFVALTTESADESVIDFANSFAAQRYSIFGAKAGGAIQPTLSWFVEARNLGDEHYAASTGVIRDAAGRDQPQFLPGEGRSVYAGLTWTP